jgi:hypothetical protein
MTQRMRAILRVCTALHAPVLVLRCECETSFDERATTPGVSHYWPEYSFGSKLLLEDLATLHSGLG